MHQNKTWHLLDVLGFFCLYEMSHQSCDQSWFVKVPANWLAAYFDTYERVIIDNNNEKN